MFLPQEPRMLLGTQQFQAQETFFFFYILQNLRPFMSPLHECYHFIFITGTFSEAQYIFQELKI